MSDPHFFCLFDRLPEFKRAIHRHLRLIFMFFSCDPDLSRGDQRDWSARAFESTGYECRSGGFPFSTGHSDDIHAFSRVSRERKCEYSATPMIDDSERAPEADTLTEELHCFHREKCMRILLM